MWKKSIKFIDENLTETVSVLSLLLYYCFDDFFSKLNFLELEDSNFQTLIIGILILILNYIAKRIKKYLYEKSTKIIIVFLNDSRKILDKDKDCYINFDNSMNLGVFHLNLRAIGDPKLLQEANVNIHFTSNIKINEDTNYNDYYTISSNQSSLTLKVEKFFNVEKTKRVDENKTIKVHLYKEGIDENNQVDLDVDDSTIHLNHNNLIF